MWLKKIRKKKMQSLIIVLILLICSTLMTSSLVIITAGDNPYNELVEECKSPVVKIYPFQSSDYEIAEQVKEKLEGLEQVEEVEILHYNYLLDKLKVKEKEVDAFFDLLTYSERMHGNVRMLAGTKELGEGECMISAVLANSEHIEIGDRIEAGSKISYVVKGIYTDPFNMNLSFDSEIVVQENPFPNTEKYVISVFSKEGVTGDEIVDAYREMNDTILEGRAITLEARISNNQITEKILGGILLAVSVVILIVSGAILRYMIRSTLITEKRTIAIYKTLGYKNSNIVFLYFKFYGFLVIVGTVLGSNLSKVISDSFTRITFQNLGVVSSGSGFLAAVICSAFIIAYVFLQVYFLLRNVGKISPMEVFRGENAYKGKKRKNVKGSLKFSPISMAFRMIFRDKKNTCMIIITCIMATYCVNMAATCMSLLNDMEEKNYYWLGFDKHDISFTSVDLSTYEETVKRLEEEEEVEKVIKTTTDVAVSLQWEKGMGDTILSAMIYNTYENLDMQVIEGRNPLYPNEIALGNMLAKKMNKHVGDYVDIYFNGTKKVSLLICGTYQSFYDMGKSCRLLGDTLTENNIAFQYSEGSIYLKNGVKKEDFLEKYSKIYEREAGFIKREAKYENILQMITGPQMIAIKPFMTFAILLGGLNIVAIVYLKNKSSQKNFSIYKAVGYSSNHLLFANISYILIIAVLSTCITIPVFLIAFPRTMVLAMSAFGFREYPVAYKISTVIISNLGALIIYLISGLIASKSLYNNPVEELVCE